MSHVTLTDIRKLVLLEGGEVDRHVAEHLASGCHQCGQLIQHELIDGRRISSEHEGWHASDRELELLVDDLPSVPIEILVHLREGCPYCDERAHAVYKKRTIGRSSGQRNGTTGSFGWAANLASVPT